MKRPALGSSLRVRIPCRRMHAWADDLSTVGPMAAFAVKHDVGTPRMGLRRPLPLWIYVGPRDAKEHLTIRAATRLQWGGGGVPRGTLMGSDSGIVCRSLEACDPLSRAQSLLHVKPARRQCVGAVTTPAARLAVSRETARAEALQVVSCKPCFAFPSRAVDCAAPSRQKWLVR